MNAGECASRLCACGCGEEVVGRPNKRHVNERHATRAAVRRHRLRAVDPLERYRDEVWNLRRAGEIEAEEALELLVAPSPEVLARLASQVAA